MRVEVGIRQLRNGFWKCRPLTFPVPRNLQEALYPPIEEPRLLGKSPRKFKGEHVLWVEWKTVTVGLWRGITETDQFGRYPSMQEMELRCWDFVADQSNLFGTKEEKIKVLKDFIPSKALHLLVMPVFVSARLNKNEEYTIKKEI